MLFCIIDLAVVYLFSDEYIHIVDCPLHKIIIITLKMERIFLIITLPTIKQLQYWWLDVCNVIEVEILSNYNERCWFTQIQCSYTEYKMDHNCIISYDMHYINQRASQNVLKYGLYFFFLYIANEQDIALVFNWIIYFGVGFFIPIILLIKVKYDTDDDRLGIKQELFYIAAFGAIVALLGFIIAIIAIWDGSPVWDVIQMYYYQMFFLVALFVSGILPKLLFLKEMKKQVSVMILP